MKQPVKGFTLVELVIVIAISGLLSSVLYTIFQQTTKTTRSLIKTLDTDEALALLYSQLEKDISSACIPAVVYEQLKNKKDPKKENTKESKTEDKETKEENKDDKKNSKELTRLFFGEKDGQMQSYLTFISTNSLSNYSIKKPKLARIIYTIAPDSNNNDTTNQPSYGLMREERQDIFSWESNTKTTKKYPLIRHLKNLIFKFISPKQENKEAKKTTYSTHEQWPPNNSEDNTVELLPEYLVCEGDLWDSQKTKTTHFAFEYKIVASARKEQEKTTIPPTIEPLQQEQQEKTVVIKQVGQI